MQLCFYTKVWLMYIHKKKLWLHFGESFMQSANCRSVICRKCAEHVTRRLYLLISGFCHYMRRLPIQSWSLWWSAGRCSPGSQWQWNGVWCTHIAASHHFLWKCREAKTWVRTWAQRGPCWNLSGGLDKVVCAGDQCKVLKTYSFINSCWTMNHESVHHQYIKYNKMTTLTADDYWW